MRTNFYDPDSEDILILTGKWKASYSGGKDSTSVVTWIEWLRRTSRIYAPRPQLVQSDTTVEDPKLEATSRMMRALLESSGWVCTVVIPEVHERLYPQILGRGLLPIHPGIRRLRWCTRPTKIDPMQRTTEEGEDLWQITGLRLGESAMRDGKLKKSSCAAGGECGIPEPGKLRHSPIKHWTTCQVIDWLNGSVALNTTEHRLMAEVFAITKQLVEVYGMRIGQPAFAEFGEPEIEAARFGCTGCPAIGVGPEAPRSVVKRYGAGSPLNELYEVWFEARQDANRLFRVKPSGKVVRGPLRIEVRQRLFERVMDIQRRSGVTLISREDEAFIRQCWQNKVYPRGWSEADEFTEPPSDTPLFDLPVV